MNAQLGQRQYPGKDCRSQVELVVSDDVNAWADGTRVLVTSAIARRCGNDAELALVIAHELAHNLLGHRALLAPLAKMRSGQVPMSVAAATTIRETEEQADRLGVSLAAASGYDLGTAVGFLEGLLNPVDGPRRAAVSHPDTARRLALMRTEVLKVSLPTVL